MRSGEIKFYNPTKGFGFITDDKGGDVFFHVSAVADRRDLDRGDRVEFESAEGERGPKATRVVPV